MDRIPITINGFEALKKELKNLKTVERPRNIESIEIARAHGDLSENAEYDAAKEKQAFIQGRINELEFKLSNAEVIDPSKLPKDKIVFGSKILVENVDSGEEVEYQLVGPEESDIDNGKVSVTSPLGRAILGKIPGDEVTVQAPAGKRIYEIVEIL